MTPLEVLLDRGPGALKAAYLSFGGGAGYVDDDFWLSDDASALRSAFTSIAGDHEAIDNSFADYANHALKRNGVVFTCCTVRQAALSEARFQFQRITDGRPGELYDAPELALLHRPAPNWSTGDMIARLDQDPSLAGNAYLTVTDDGHLRRLRPDWVKIVVGVPRGMSGSSPFDINARVVGYVYAPKSSTGADPDPVLLSPDRVVHNAPIPDPMAQFRGMSWMTPVLREIDGDSAAMEHKINYFRNGTTSNLVLSYDPTITPEVFKDFVELFKQSHEGVSKAYKALHLGGGVDPKMLGADMKQLDFKVTQGHGETRIAAASGVGAVVAQLSEGLQGSSLNAGNFAVAMRRCGDLTLRPLWRRMAAALESVVAPPAGDRLWYDTRDIEFLKADRKDAAAIEQQKASTIRTLVDGGFTPESVVAAVEAENMALLVHSGRTSVQLHELDGAPTPPED